ncbi:MULTISPECIES: translation elongation factor EF-1 subunit alpha [Thermococcus]|uniref:Elongation factor 1-alpha n=2 Tax=Thermococcus sibiricus (strain DSM 12597 / MM 739) TaxID=604354 RepID=EF1A_THESM|nr:MULTISPECIES: translation elongation factor EF-1 subunit alpha [Thermococcus]C6A4R7.1 RecName: Full=Elongation factor 1-alpha; Short=EF-1-alpha; AltName: Full=Elongation factor Tu; Short=EF-Tu [Thermococcus sibiricus MM 739]ACS90612.1 Elongation factor 1-alpha [Thermococcus sibiricus MM 739]MBC7094577.1 translation elongation factor EF-1 subunit alpha [Thermococcus sp.]HII67660.1 translation elongation factor EF-1 subunit alpha [Thermococcaceae archaeon]
MAKEKPHVNIVFIGHVDHGKSTTIGRLLFDTANIPEQIIKKFEEMGEKGKSFKFAWVMDRLKEERERGITIDVAHTKFETPHRYITIIDAPGHRDFVKNMITGASQADAAVLIVAATDGVMPQTKEHAFLARTLGINHIIVGVNKMDAVKYDEKRFKEVATQVTKLLQMLGYKNFPVIPISAWEGDNVVKKSDKMPWYNGPTLIEALDQIPEPEKPTDKPLRIPIQDVYSIKGVGTVPVGRVETGVLKVGDVIIFEPASTIFHKPIQGEVKSIEMHHESMPEALPGDNIGFNVRGVGKNDIKRGDVAGHTTNPPTVVRPRDTFKAQIIVLNHPTAITIGYTPVLHAHTTQVAVRFEQLLAKLDPRTGNVVEENPQFIKTGDSAIVVLRPTKPMVIEPVKELPQLGRFAIRDMGQTVAAGMVISIQKGE